MSLQKKAKKWGSSKLMCDKKERYALGIDGGGSKTSFTLIDEEEQIIDRFVLGGTAFDTYSPEKIKETFMEAKKRLSFAPSSVFAGIGGIIGETKKNICSSLLKDVFSGALCASDNDCVNALYAISEHGEGIILIAGTGSVSYGEYQEKSARSGGYCYQEGDLGSSYDIGRKALQYFAKGIDGREKTGILFDAIKEKLGFDNQVSFASYMEKAGRKEIASFAKLVTENETDPYAEKIILMAAQEAYQMVEAIYRRLDINIDVPFGVIGGLGTADSLYRTSLLKMIESNLKHLRLYKGEVDPGKGSAKKAKEILWNGSLPR